MEQHFILCGFGHLGRNVWEVFEAVNERTVVVALEMEDRWAEQLRQKHTAVIHGDARDLQNLRAADISKARGLLVLTDDDLANVEIALDARELRPDLPIVLRLFDRTLAMHIEATLGAVQILAVSDLAAPAFVAAACGDGVSASFVIGGDGFVAGQLEVKEGSPLAGKTISELERTHEVLVMQLDHAEESGSPQPAANLRVLPGTILTVLSGSDTWRTLSGCHAPTAAPERQKVSMRGRCLALSAFWQRVPFSLRAASGALAAVTLLSVPVFSWGMQLSLIDALYYVITTVTTVGYGDISPVKANPWLKLYACVVMLLGSASIAVLFSIITDAIVRARFLQMTGRRRVREAGHFVVAGLSNLGFRIVEALERAGASVVVVERQSDGEFTEAARASAPVILGDARQAEIQHKAGMDKARAVIAVTENDAVNLSIALSAQERNPHVRTVVRFTESDFAHKVKASLRLGSALTLGEISAPAFVAAALYPNVQTAFLARGRLRALVKQEARSEWEGRTLEQLREQSGVFAARCDSSSAGRRTLVRDDRPLRKGEILLVLIPEK